MKPSHAANDILTGRTRQFWRPRTARNLTDEDARQIAENVTSFFGVLAEWAQAEKMAAAANNNALPKEGEVGHDR
jgi:hypothetical protein